MADMYTSYGSGLSAPALDGFAITPSDSTVFSQPTRTIYVGTGGNIAVTTVQGTSLTFKNLPSGSLLPVRCAKVMATGTTATDLIGLY